MLKITATFIDEIIGDIPHQNWLAEDWDKDFAAMKAIGIAAAGKWYLSLPFTVCIVIAAIIGK